MNFFKELLINWKYYKNVRANTKGLQFTKGFLPSDLHYKYLKDTTFDGKKVLNVGCGKGVYKVSNVTNLDAFPGDGVNIVWDLSKTPLPFESNSFDLIIANHVLEHIPNWFECFKELARIVKVGGEIEIWIPPVSSDSAFTYRDHINIIGDQSFTGCRSCNRSGTNLAAAAEIRSVGEVAKLEIVQKNIRMAVQWWITLAPQCVQTWMSEYLRNTVSEIGYVFKKRDDYGTN